MPRDTKYLFCSCLLMSVFANACQVAEARDSAAWAVVAVALGVVSLLLAIKALCLLLAETLVRDDCDSPCDPRSQRATPINSTNPAVDANPQVVYRA